MSLIHEALKKAEEQRRLGQPPDLASPFARRRERQPLLPFLLVAIVIAAGAGWWFLRTPVATTAAKSAAADSPAKAPAAPAPRLAGQQDNAGGMERSAARSSSAERQPVAPLPAQPQPPPIANSAAPKAALAAMPPATKPAGSEPGKTPLPAGPAATGSEKAMPPGATSQQAKPGPEALKQAMDSAAKIAVDTTPLNTATKPEGPAKVTKVPIPDTSPTKPRIGPESEPIASNLPAAAASTTTTAPGAKKAELPDSEPVTGPMLSPPAAAPSVATPSDKLPLFWQLTYLQRKDLPQLNMSMHVYAADPGKRFIVINGDHKAEGDTIGADLYVREIRSDGVVMEFHGLRFLVPRGGS